MMKENKSHTKRYKVNVKQLAEAVYSKNKAKYLGIYGSANKAKSSIKDIIGATFEEIKDEMLNDRVVEIWGFASFGLQTHRRFLTKYAQCNFGHNIKKSIKAKEDEMLKIEVLELINEIEELEQDFRIDENSELLELIESKKQHLDKLKKSLELKGKSLNPKYQKE